MSIHDYYMLKLTFVKHALHLIHLWQGPGQSVDAFNVQTEEINSLDTLVDDHGNSQPISLIQPSEGDSEDRS